MEADQGVAELAGVQATRRHMSGSISIRHAAAMTWTYGRPSGAGGDDGDG